MTEMSAACVVCKARYKASATSRKRFMPKIPRLEHRTLPLKKGNGRAAGVVSPRRQAGCADRRPCAHRREEAANLHLATCRAALDRMGKIPRRSPSCRVLLAK